MKSPSPPTNETVFAQIDEYAQTKYPQYFPDGASCPAPTRGAVEVDYWSISYRLTFRDGSIFIKIPKADMYEADILSILRDPRARNSGEAEFEAFTKIHAIGDWPEGCSTVRPLEYVPQFNAIVTEFFPSKDLFVQCRRASTVGRLTPGRNPEGVHASLARCGAWLRHFQRAHDAHGQVAVRSDQLLSQMTLWSKDIERTCIRPRFLKTVLEALRASRWSVTMPEARTCEGFEVRNIIVDGAGTVRLVDPGQLSWASGLEDVAHFLVSLTLLFWGTPSLWLGIPTAREYRRCFLRAWALQDAQVPERILAWFEMRELIRQWREAHLVVSRKPYPAAVRRCLGGIYVDPFFHNRIAATLLRASDK
jgi:hypothetical protein